MARRSRRRDADTFDIANDPIITELSRPVLLPVSPVSRLDEFLGDTLPFDRREFSFGEPERYTLGSSSVDAVSPQRLWSHEPAFTEPRTVAICHRRQVRKEVMIAKKRKGRGGSPRRDWRSEIKC